MRLITPVITGGLALTAGCLLAACSGASPSPPASAPGGLTIPRPSWLSASHAITASGHMLKYSYSVGTFEHSVAARGLPEAHGARGNVYLSNYELAGSNVAVLANKRFNFVSTMTNGISTPDGEWTDSSNNLYVTNYYPNNNVVEFACTITGCGTYPIFTYSYGLSNANNVTTDKTGNVYVTSYRGSSAGQVTEYAQGSNTVLQSCSVAAISGVAVDSSTGDVYVAHGDSGIQGYIEKFSGGLAGCNGTQLGATFGSPGDVILDNQKNIIVCDQWNGAVDVIDPPYTSITKTIGSGWIDPYEPALEKHGKKMLLYISDSGSSGGYGLIGVYDYPSGTRKATISGSNSGPFKDPYGVTDTLNYVP